MDFKNNYAVAVNFLIKNLADELFRGAKMIGKIDDPVYRKSTTGTGSIGSHFRHNLDFVNAFVYGLGTGKIDYNRRERDLQIEENRLYAINMFADAVSRFRRLPVEIFNKKVLIRSEINSDFWLESSAMRELEFLHSHTIHHHALIADKLKSFGVHTAKDFGVAPSTLKFWAEEKQAA
ncbi:hypothetical protein BH20ACI4_BH20ACI4_01290 [soil metagenome]